MDTIKDRAAARGAVRVGERALAQVGWTAAEPAAADAKLGLSPAGPLRRVLAIGCHADDIEIGCGGTLLDADASRTRTSRSTGSCSRQRASAGRGAGERRRRSSRRAATARVEVHGFRDGFLPYGGREVKELFEELKGRVDPQVVLTHTRHDLHQDHRLACELTWNTFRNHLILEYEIPKFDGDLGRPNFFVPLSAAIVEEKVALLERHFPSQAGKHWFDRETFLGLMRLRGMEAVAPGAATPRRSPAARSCSSAAGRMRAVG